MNNPAETTHAGRCICGAVAYEAAGPPDLVIICHCAFCQRATGSAFLVEPIWRDQDFRVTAGTPKRHVARSAGSGKRVTLHFCKTCGTKLFQTMERFRGVVGVYGGTLDTPAIAAEARQTWRIFADEAQATAVTPPGVDVWRRHRFETDGTPAAPIRYEDFHVGRPGVGPPPSRPFAPSHLSRPLRDGVEREGQTRSKRRIDQ